MYIVEVAIDAPIYKLFSYESKQQILTGTRVEVEFRNRCVIGIVLNCCLATSIMVKKYKLKPIITIYTDIVSQFQLDLCYFLSKYYHYPLGATLFIVLPNLFKKKLAIKSSNPYFKLIDTNIIDKLKANKQQLLYQELRKRALPKSKFKQILGVNYNKLINLWLNNNIIKECSSNEISHLSDIIIKPKITTKLNKSQQFAVGEISQKLNQFYPTILFGITGSGKTEVYLELVESVVNSGKQALILVPEINLTQHLITRFNKRFNHEYVQCITSNLTDKQRLDIYLQARDGAIKVIIGTRLAVFSEFSNLGLIVVDEEHDQSFKQCDSLRYNARDIAVWRAKYLNIPIILGSATPSLETLYNYKLNKYTLYSLLDRGVSNSVPAKIELIKPLEDAIGLDSQLIKQLEKRLLAKQLSLIFINRRGYAPVLMCYSCGWISSCSSCSAKMVVHKYDQQLKCHYCAVSYAIPNCCPMCKSIEISAIGEGTQKIEDVLLKQYPSANIARIDQDSLANGKVWADIYQKINRHEVDILVGTQILSKGHDFHNLTLVIGLSLDNALYSQDFRAIELLFAQLMQVTGRAGRGDLPGEVYLVTKFPEHYLYYYLLKQDFIGFANHILSQRKKFNLPPYCFYSIFRASSFSLATAMHYLDSIYNQIVSLKILSKFSQLTISPPCQVAMAKLQNKYRAQILIQSNDREQLHRFLTLFMDVVKQVKSAGIATTYLDVDPVDIG